MKENRGAGIRTNSPKKGGFGIPRGGQGGSDLYFLSLEHLAGPSAETIIADIQDRVLLHGAGKSSS